MEPPELSQLSTPEFLICLVLQAGFFTVSCLVISADLWLMQRRDMFTEWAELPDFRQINNFRFKIGLRLAKILSISGFCFFSIPVFRHLGVQNSFIEVLLFLLLLAMAYGFAKHKIFPEHLPEWLSSTLRLFSALTDRFFAGRPNMVAALQGAAEVKGPGSESHEKQKLLEDITRFGGTLVWEVMTPKTMMVTVRKTDTFQEVLKTIRSSGYSRMPVLDGEKAGGILFSKDLLQDLGKEEFAWQTFIREAYFVAPDMKIAELLEELRQKKIHLAVVAEDAASFQGIITLDDIIEEIVGDIEDEFDREEVVYSRLDEHNFIFEGRTPLEDFSRIIEDEGFEMNTKEATIAGFLKEFAGHVPKKHEQVRVNGCCFTVEAADKRKVIRVKVTIEK